MKLLRISLRWAFFQKMLATIDEHLLVDMWANAPYPDLLRRIGTSLLLDTIVEESE